MIWITDVFGILEYLLIHIMSGKVQGLVKPRVDGILVNPSVPLRIDSANRRYLVRQKLAPRIGFTSNVLRYY